MLVEQSDLLGQAIDELLEDVDESGLAGWGMERCRTDRSQ
jgi:hypothetical protein